MNEDIYSVEERIRMVKAWLDGRLSPEEADVLQEWAEQSPDNMELLDRVADPGMLAARMNFCDSNDKEAGWRSIQKKLRRPSLFIHFARYAAAVVMVSTIGLAVYFSLAPEAPLPLVRQDALPVQGSAIAYLQLATGEHYLLDSMQTIDARVEGAVLRTEKTGRLVVAGYAQSSLEQQTEYHRIVVPVAGEYNMLLADGTRIWINSSSVLEFPACFSAGERRVRLLEGEAYFEVAQRSAQPFVLEVQDKEICVLGTSFNVNTYENEFATTLVSGKVEVTVEHHTYLLSPGKQLQVTDNRVTINEVDTYDFTAWKEGMFVFRYQPLEKVLATLARWYDIQVLFEKEELKKFHYTGKIERHSNIQEVLHFLQRTGSVKFSLDGRILVVSE